MTENNTLYIIKKIVLSAVLLSLGMINMYADNDWKVGDDISSQLDWGDYTGKTNSSKYWRGTSAAYANNEWEVYQGSDVDRYQILYLPAGIYKFKCQAFYRDGINEDAGKKYFAGTSSTNAVLYVENGFMTDKTGNKNGSFVTSRVWSTPLCSQWVNMNTQQLFETTDWRNDAQYEHGDETYWAPNCMESAEIYFSKGMYDKNEVRFVVMQDGYVKLGIRKPGNHIASDWLIFTNFRIIYDGEAGESVVIAISKQRYDDVIAECRDLYDEISASGHTGLAGLLDNMVTAIDDNAQTFITSSEYDESANALENIHKKFGRALIDTDKLSVLIKNCESIANTSVYAGLESFVTAINEAKKVFNADASELSSYADFEKAYNALSAARVKYLLTQEPQDGGMYDFSRLINFPFFCNNEYTPTWNSEKGYYVYEDEIENTWTKIQEQNWVDVYTDHPGWDKIASDVTWTTNPNEAGEWIYNQNNTSGWMGEIENVIIQHGYTAVGAWSGDPVVGYQEMRQVISGIPNGYYSVGALFINAGNEPDGGQYIYINPGTKPDNKTMEKAQFTQACQHWWTGDASIWRTQDWQNLRTEMVYVDNGSITIGSRSTWFYAVTGFQLYYFGDRPSFNELIVPLINEAKTNIVTHLSWKGDIAAANAILGKIPSNIQDKEVYQQAFNTIQEANEYVVKASAVIDEYNKTTLADFTRLTTLYDTNSDEHGLAVAALNRINSLGEAEDDTYLKALSAAEDYNAYASYLSYVKKAQEFVSNNPELERILLAQFGELKAKYATAATLQEYMQVLSVPYNRSILISLGIEQATIDNPVDVTMLIVNSDYSQGAKGWKGEMTVDSLGTVECWNRNFNVSQTVYNLPAGRYRIQVQAFYRDNLNSGEAYKNWWQTDAYNDITLWKNANAILYANSEETFLTSIASFISAEQSHSQYVEKWQLSEKKDELGNDIMEPVWVYQEDAKFGTENEYPWDEKVDDLGNVYYYPNSLRGASCRFAKSEDAYINTVEVAIEEDESMTFGIKKNVTIDGDWVAMDNWKLFYLGEEEPVVGIESTTSSHIGESKIYSLDGIQRSSLSKGINIVKKADNTIVKIIR